MLAEAHKLPFSYECKHLQETHREHMYARPAIRGSYVCLTGHFVTTSTAVYGRVGVQALEHPVTDSVSVTLITDEVFEH